MRLSILFVSYSPSHEVAHEFKVKRARRTREREPIACDRSS